MSPRKFTYSGETERRQKANQYKEGVFIVERRKHPRISIELPLDYSLVDSIERHGGMAANISKGGLLVYLPEALQLGTLLNN